jgi:hypothetical protein
MRSGTVVAVCAVVVAGLGATASGAHAQPSGAVQWKVGHVRRCSRADTLFGRLWRSHSTTVRIGYSPSGDSTEIRTPVRTVSWATTSSRLVGTEGVIRVPGRDVKVDSARLEITMRFVDSIYRSAEQAAVDLQIDDSVHYQVPAETVDYAMGALPGGIPVIVTVRLTPEQSFALARGNEVRGSMGGYPFFLYGWELWDLNAIYRVTVCGLD